MTNTTDDVFGYDRLIRMLIIDDDLHVLAVLEDLFSTEKDVAVTATSDSREAIHLIQQQHFDVVITDLMMPRSDGLAVTKAVQESSPGTLVIIITGFASLETTLEAIHLGVYDYITKPFQIDEFRLLVSNASWRIRLERENEFLQGQVAANRREIQHLRQSNTELVEELEALRKENSIALEPALSVMPPITVSSSKLSIYERIAGGYRKRSASDEDADKGLKSVPRQKRLSQM